MIAKLKFKELEHKAAGSFKPQGTDELVEYPEKYIFKFADVTANGELFEGEAKIDVNNKELIDKLSKFRPFEDITVEIYFDIKQKYTRVIVKDVIIENLAPDVTEEKTIN